MKSTLKKLIRTLNTTKIGKLIQLSELNQHDQTVVLIQQSHLFDEKFYVSNYLNGKWPREGAIIHYLNKGVKKNYNPNEFFDTKYYLTTYSDVKNARINPLVHYIIFGWKEGRNPAKNFDTTFYLSLHTDVKKEGLNPLYHYLYWGKKEGRTAVPKNQYAGWIALYDTLNEDDKKKIKTKIETFKLTPLISIVIPVYNPDIFFLGKAIESVKNQLYPYWELCIADDASTNKEVKNVLNNYTSADQRIKVVFRKKNGHISEASNSALELVKGEFVALLDQDDELREHSLFMIVNEINKRPDLKLIYTDEDKINENGDRFDPHFKPEWSLDLLHGQNYISHLGVYNTRIIKKIGGFRKGFEGSQDYDLLLRFIEQINPDQIKRIPHILYHWRALPGSTALSVGEKNYALEAGVKALQEHVIRTKQNAVAELAPKIKHLYRVKYKLPSKKPFVSLIIPTKDKVDILDNCVQSILKKTNYENYEIIIVDNNSSEQKSKKYFNKITASNKNVTVLHYDKPFNFSAINNFAAHNSKGEIIGLINNDIEVINNEWLCEMVSHLTRKEVGAVGAKLYYENNNIQHAGVVIGLGGVAGHIHKYKNRNEPGYFGRLHLVQNFSACTAACLLIKRNVFNEVNGMNEKHLTVAFNDVDLCLKIREKGHLIVWTPYAELYHLESISRGNDNDADKIERFHKEIDYMKKTWKTDKKVDPYYNPNFSIEVEDYILAFPPLVEKNW